MTSTITYTWTSNSSADWSTVGDWGATGVPSASTQNVTLLNAVNTSTPYTVTFSAADGTAVRTGTASSLQIGDTGSGGHAILAISAGATLGYTALTLSTGGTISLSGTFEARNATVSGGVIKGSGVVQSTTSSGTWQFNSGSVEASGTLDFGGSTTGLTFTALGSAGLTDFVIDSGAELILDKNATISSGNTIDFLGAGTLAIGNLGSAASGDFNSTHTFLATVNGVVANGSQSSASVFDLLNAGSVTVSSSVLAAGGNTTLTVNDNSQTYTIIATGTSISATQLHTATDGNGGLLFWVCYAAGTRILADQGEIAVEDIAAGDRVVTLQNGEPVLQPVKWVGSRHLDLTRHPKPETAAPIRIARDAFGENQPHRDLVVSPDHGLLVDGKLIPAKLLINGTTIIQDRSVKSVTYYHIELDRHAILLAEGLPAESYLDTGNRAFFANAGLALVLHPEFEVNANLKCWEEDACAPLAVAPDVVGPVWHRLADRAAALGYSAPAVQTTQDADVHLIADGRSLRPLSVDRDRYVFMLPAGVTDLRLVSRASQPLAVVPYHDDPRTLGVLVSRIQIRNGETIHDVPLDHPALSDGWHAVEQANGRAMRWTDGEGALPISGAAHPLIVEMKIHQMDAYLVAGSAAPARLAA